MTEWTTCKGCGKKIKFVRTAKGKMMPVTEEGTNHFLDCPKANQF